MSWVPEPGSLQQLLQLLRVANDASSQALILKQFEVLKQHPDWARYLMFVLINCTSEPDHVREFAGVTLKNFVLQNVTTIAPSVQASLRADVANILGDNRSVIRRTAANIITSIVKKTGLAGWPELIPGLLGNLNSQSFPILDGTLYTFQLLFEDYCSELDSEALGQPLQFILPKLFQFYQHPHEQLRFYSLCCTAELIFPLPPTLILNMDTLLKGLFLLVNDTADKVRHRVCRVFVTLAEIHVDALLPYIHDVLAHVLHFARDTEEKVAIEACAFWVAAVESPEFKHPLKGILPNLLPILLQNMIYTDLDITLLEIEEARSAKNPSLGLDDGDSQTDWNIRKSSCHAVEALACVFQDELLPLVLPMIQQALNSDRLWQFQECGILALGCISRPCRTGLSPHMAGILEFLIQQMNHPKSAIRAITCWSMSRCWEWVSNNAAHSNNPERFLKPLLNSILLRMQDPSMKVRHAACSSLAILEEVGEEVLTDYVGVILQALMTAFQTYHPSTLLTVYDGISTLATSMKDALNNEQCISLMIPPLISKWNALADNDENLLPLIECLASICSALGTGFLPLEPMIVPRSIKILENTLLQHAVAQQDSHYEEPHYNFLADTLDLLSAIGESLKNLGSLCQHTSLMPSVLECTRFAAPNVRVSAYGFIGVLAKFSFELLSPHLDAVMQGFADNLIPEVARVCSNASWALGEIAVHAREAISNYTPVLAPLLVTAVLESVGSDPFENVCVCFCRLGLSAPNFVGPHLDKVLKEIRDMFRNKGWSEESESALLGLVSSVVANPAVICTHYTLVAECILAHPSPSQDLAQRFCQIVHYPRISLPSEWPRIRSSVPGRAMTALKRVYNVS
ncbi:hypothetical protein Pelo_14006 [Pelomyxa schiedti]|nr:hypothetical protein Pelo_14006 [Pelomyxa schiedti]